MTEPNRLRNEAVPNVFRGAATPDRLPPGGATGRPGALVGRRAEAGALASQPGVAALAKPRRSGSRNAIVAGLLLAVAGVPLFFAPGVKLETTGLGMVTLGTGVVVTTFWRRLVADWVRASRRSVVAGAVGLLFAAPHLAAIAIVGLGLVAFGLACLAAGFGLL